MTVLDCIIAMFLFRYDTLVDITGDGGMEDTEEQEETLLPAGGAHSAELLDFTGSLLFSSNQRASDSFVLTTSRSYVLIFQC